MSLRFKREDEGMEQLQESEGERSSHRSLTEVAGFSRRGFLKIIGGTALGSVVANVVMPEHLIAAMEQPDALWSLIATSPLFLTALEQVETQGCSFTIDATNVRVIAQQENVVGVHIQQSSRPTQRLGIDIICTIDTLQNAVVAVRYLIGTSLDDALELRSVLLTPASLTPILIPTRSGVSEQPGPHQAITWSFPRPVEKIPPAPDVLPPAGWPPDLISPLHWFYGGMVDVLWSSDTSPHVICKHVVEQRSTDSTDFHIYALPYPTDADLQPEPQPIMASAETTKELPGDTHIN